MMERTLGTLLGAGAMFWWRRPAAVVPQVVPAASQPVSTRQQQDHEQALQQLADLQQQRSDAAAQLGRLQHEHQALMQQAAVVVKSKALRHCDSLGEEITQLLGLVKTFERWHAEMNLLLAHNREMHTKSEEFSAIVDQVVIVALNASIEAARAERLSKDYRDNLYKNDLITTTTFQDLQAGGKMIVGAVISLVLINNKSKHVLAEAAA